MKFGYIYFLICSAVIIFSFLAAIHPFMAIFNTICQCCVSIPGTVQVIYVGVYRFSWSGSACSTKGAPLESYGKFLLNMFIAQLVLTGFYTCCASLGTPRKSKWSREKITKKIYTILINKSDISYEFIFFELKLSSLLFFFLLLSHAWILSFGAIWARLLFGLLALDITAKHSNFLILVFLEVKSILFAKTKLKQVVVETFFADANFGRCVFQTVAHEVSFSIDPVV